MILRKVQGKKCNEISQTPTPNYNEIEQCLIKM